MKIQKRILAPLPEVYVVNSIIIDGQIHFLAASEARGGQCLLFSPPDWKPSVVWQTRGGCMSIVPIPNTEKQFLAIEAFFPIFQSEGAGIVHGRAGDELEKPWNINRVIDLPFVHRFEIVQVAGQSFVIAAALCKAKDFQDDWSKPGAVYVTPIPQDVTGKWTLTPVLENITKNHGMYRAQLNGAEYVFITGEEGIFQIQADRKWPVTQISDTPTSDICIADIDNDGTYEVVTIEPFHGNELAVYKLNESTLTPIYRTGIDFGHVAWAGRFNDSPTIIAGNRGGEKDLVMICPDSGDFDNATCHVIDTQVGPTQITVANVNNSHLIVSANHAAGEVALYTVN